MDEKIVEELTTSVKQLNKNLEREISFKFIVLRGLVYGISIVIGTTILASILLSVLNNFPVLENIIERSQQ